MPGQTTTIEIKTDLWAALDRRKDRGESFDDVIRRIINDATPVPVGELAGPHPDVETKDVQPVEAQESWNEGCAYYDTISAEGCGQTPKYKQMWRYSSDHEWESYYYCEEHAPTDAIES